MAKFDPQPTINPEPIVPKFETRDYVADIFFSKYLGSIRAGGFAPHIRKYTHKFFECLLHFFSFLPKVYRRARWTDIHALYVIQRASAQGIAFWGLENLSLKFDCVIKSQCRNFTIAPMGKLKKNHVAAYA